MEISQYGLDFDAAATVTTAAIARHFEKRFSIDGKRMSNAANNHRFKSKWNDTYANSAGMVYLDSITIYLKYASHLKLQANASRKKKKHTKFE